MNNNKILLSELIVPEVGPEKLAPMQYSKVLCLWSRIIIIFIMALHKHNTLLYC